MRRREGKVDHIARFKKDDYSGLADRHRRRKRVERIIEKVSGHERRRGAQSPGKVVDDGRA